MSLPLASPGPLSEAERFLFEVSGFLVIRGALRPDEVDDLLAAARRLHDGHPREQWRQIGHAYEQEPAMAELIDHPSTFGKVRALLGDYFILQSSWCTRSPAGFPGGSIHQDGSSVYEFRRLGGTTPLVQLRIGYFLTDQSQPNMGNLVVIPGSHNSHLPMPKNTPWTDLPIAQVILGQPGDALLFHQGVWHGGVGNEMPYDRYIQHMVYAPPWLVPSDRRGNDPTFLAQTTPLRRALLGEWNRPEEPFGVGYPRPPFGD